MKSKIIICLLTLMSAANFSPAQTSFLFSKPVKAFANDRVTVKEILLSTGVRLQYAEQGDVKGTPVVFLHGITDSWHSFESVLPNLPSSIRAFAISQRGHGDSERPAEGYAPKDFAADVASFLKQKKINKAFIVGHSMGGINAQQFAIDYPELTRGMIIIDADPVLKNNPGMSEFHAEVMKMEGAIDRKFMDEFQKATLAKPIDSGYYNLLVDEGIKVPARVFQAALTGLLNVDYSERLKEVNAPALIFWGSKDAFCAFKGQEMLVNNIKNSTLIIYGNTGHALHWEEPQKFTTDLINFIENN